MHWPRSGQPPGFSNAAGAEPLRIFYFTWIGEAPLFVAQDKGFFAEEGIEVSLIGNDDHTAAFAGLAAGQVDAASGSLQDIVLFAAPDEDPEVVAESLSGIHLYDGEENRAYFGTPDHPGQIYETMQHIIGIWSSLGRIKADVSPADVIRHDLWVE